MTRTSTRSTAPFLPRLRPGVVVGPPLVSGDKIVHFVKDPSTNWYYRIGEKESYLMQLMDGSHSLPEINRAYATRFGRALSHGSWQNLLTMLDKRQFLLHTTEEERLDALKTEAEARKKGENKQLWKRQWTLLNPDRILTALLPLVRFAFRRTFVLPALVAILLMEVFVLVQSRALLSDVSAIFRHQNIFLIYGLFLALSWSIAALHELAHGLACKHFGGSVHNMGISWRYLTFFPYCNVDDVMMFHNRFHRLYVFAAGGFVNFLVLLPFVLLWLFLPGASELHALSALMLLPFNIGTLLNFIPFVELDGYFMLNHALNMADLRQQAHSYSVNWLRRFVLRQRVPEIIKGKKYKVIYLTYGLLSFLFTGLFLIFASYSWYAYGRQWLGSTATLLILGAALVLIGVRWYRERRKRVVS
jgi:putative peptide zinc metalloprotease protein